MYYVELLDTIRKTYLDRDNTAFHLLTVTVNRGV